MPRTLTDNELLRYNRQIILRNFDTARQKTLKHSRVLIVGLGGLGCAASQYLASAGTGHLTLLDFDTVSLSNLQRQILHTTKQIGKPKVLSACQHLKEINPLIEIDPVQAHLAEDKLATLICRHDVVLDCSDNLPTREQLNRLCFSHKIPLISGAAIRMEGQISVFNWSANTPCYHCLSRQFNTEAPTCVESGIMAPLVGVIGALQAMETVRLLTDYGPCVTSKLLLYDALRLQFHTINLVRDQACEVCHTSSPTED